MLVADETFLFLVLLYLPCRTTKLNLQVMTTIHHSVFLHLLCTNWHNKVVNFLAISKRRGQQDVTIKSDY